MRTDDTAYGEDYWNSMDNGAGYQDGVIWEDLAFSVKEVYGIEGIDPKSRDISGDIHHLDIGCASGFLSHHLRRRGMDSYGCDISQWVMDRAPDEVRPFIRLHDITMKPIPDYSTVGFNLITCYETMEHIPEHQVVQTLGHIYDRLNPGGRALFTICLSDREGWETDPTHVTIHDRSWWEERLAAAGFQDDQEAFRRIKEFYLYRDHNGIFALRKP